MFLELTWFSKHAALVQLLCDDDRRPARKCDKYAFCVNGLVSF